MIQRLKILGLTVLLSLGAVSINAATAPYGDHYLYILDGVVISNDEFLKIDFDHVESVSVLSEVASAVICCGVRQNIVLISTEQPNHELIVLDSDFDMFYAAYPSSEQFDLHQLRAKNGSMVQEWNRRCDNVLQFESSAYKSKIDYNVQGKYDLRFEHKLYVYMQYLKSKELL